MELIVFGTPTCPKCKIAVKELQGLIGYLPQEFGMYENMTAGDFLHYMGILKKLYDKTDRKDLR